MTAVHQSQSEYVEPHTPLLNPYCGSQQPMVRRHLKLNRGENVAHWATIEQPWLRFLYMHSDRIPFLYRNATEDDFAKLSVVHAFGIALDDASEPYYSGSTQYPSRHRFLSLFISDPFAYCTFRYAHAIVSAAPCRFVL
jgi:hypothetical protein